MDSYRTVHKAQIVGLSHSLSILTHKVPNTTIADFASTVDPDETTHNEPSHLDLQCFPSSL